MGRINDPLPCSHIVATIRLQYRRVPNALPYISTYISNLYFKMLTNLKTTDVRSRIEPELKDRASSVLAECGLNLSDAIRLFLRQVVVQQGLPFEVRTPNAVTVAAMKEARTIGQARFGNAQELFNDLEKAGAAKARKATKKQR